MGKNSPMLYPYITSIYKLYPLAFFHFYGPFDMIFRWYASIVFENQAANY